jgi:hypothetical protein
MTLFQQLFIPVVVLSLVEVIELGIGWAKALNYADIDKAPEEKVCAAMVLTQLILLGPWYHH